MKNLLINILGYFFDICYSIYVRYKILQLYKQLGKFGNGSVICYPFKIKGVENLEIGDDVSIGDNATIYCTRAKCIFKDHSFTGPNLTIITGDHAYWTGTYMKHCYKKLLKDISMYDAQVTIEEDVWIGANVVILKGVTIGRGAIIAAGSVVTKDIEPYSIAAGVPAKILKKKWNPDEIKSHEKILYS